GCHGINSVYTPSQQAGAPSLGSCVITDARLSHLIGIAYGVSMNKLKSGPDWIQRGDLRFNIQAKAEDPSKTSEQQLLAMLQNLLAERFQLKFHYDTSETNGFIMAVAKNGPKLKVSQATETKLSFVGPSGEDILKPSTSAISMKARKYSL